MDGKGPAAARSTYPQFLERLKQPSAQPIVNDIRDFVSQFPATLTRPQASRRIHSFISEACSRCFETQAWKDDLSEDAYDQALEGLEKFLVLKLHKLLFRHAPADLREDESVEECIRSASATLPLPAMSEASREMFEAACQELQKVEQYRAPRDKVVCLLNAYRIVDGIVDEAFKTNGTVARAPMLREILAALIVRSNPPNLFSNLEFTTALRHPSRLTIEEKQCLGDLGQALAFVTSADATKQRDIEALSASSDSGASATAKAPMPAWLVDAGVTFHFEDRAADELLLGEAEELLDEYHRMVRALRELSGVPQPGRESVDDKPR